MTTNKKSFFSKNSLYFFVSSLALIILTVFFSFKIFSKTTHNVQFVIQYAEDFEINPNEIADIEFLNNNNEFETLVGTNLTVEKNKPVTFRIKLNNGYKNINNIYASNIYNNNIITDGEFIDGSYRWTTDNINSDRVITINNIEAMKLNISEPVIYDFENNILDNNLYVKNWTNYVSYNNKFQFQLDLSNFKEKYRVEKVLACTELDGDLSIEISYDNNICTIELYDHDNENNYCGITSNISNLEVFLAPEYIEDSLELMAANGVVDVTFKWDLIDDKNPVKKFGGNFLNENASAEMTYSLFTDTENKLNIELYEWAMWKDENPNLSFVPDANTTEMWLPEITKSLGEVTFTWDLINGDNPIESITLVNTKDEDDKVEYSNLGGNVESVTWSGAGVGKTYTVTVGCYSWVDTSGANVEFEYKVENANVGNTINIEGIRRKTTSVIFGWSGVEGSSQNPIRDIISTWDNSVYGRQEKFEWDGGTSGSCKIANVPVGLDTEFTVYLGDYFNTKTKNLILNKIVADTPDTEPDDESEHQYTVEQGSCNFKCKPRSEEGILQINLSGFEHNDVTVKFKLPEIDNEPMGTINGKAPDDRTNEVAFDIPYGCGNTKFDYVAPALYKLSGTEIRKNNTVVTVGTREEGKANDNTLSFTLDKIYFDYEMSFKLPEIEYRMCNLKFDGNYISEGVSLNGDASAVKGSTWTGEGKSFNLSSDATFYITSNEGYTTGLLTMDAYAYDDEDPTLKKTLTLAKQKVENKTNSDDDKILSTDKLEHSFVLTTDELLTAYNNGGTIVVTLNNIKKLYKFKFDVTGIATEDETGKRDINARYNTYTVTNGNFEQRKEYDELELICGNSSEFFIPEGEQFKYTVVLPDNHYYKFKNEDGVAKFLKDFNEASCEIDKNNSIYSATLELEKNYVIANFEVNRPADVKDTDYDNLRDQFRLWELIKNDDDSISKGKELSFEDEVRIVKDENTPIILEMSVGAKLVGENGEIELLKYPVIKDNVTTKAIVDVEPIKLSSENNDTDSEDESIESASDYPKYFKCNLKSEYSATLNGACVTQTVSEETPFVIDSLINTCSVQLDCSGDMDIYVGRTSGSLSLSGNELVPVVYGHSLVLRFIHDTSKFDQEKTAQFLTTLQDYLTIESKTNKTTLLTLGGDYMVELTNTNGVYTGTITINFVTEDLILRLKASENDQQIVDFKQINGAKYIMLNKSEESYIPNSVAFTNRRIQVPVDTTVYFAVYTDNPAYDINNLKINLIIGSETREIERVGATLPIDGKTCQVYSINFKSNAGGISSISGSVPKTPLNITFTAPDTPNDWEYGESLNYIYGDSVVTPGETKTIYYGNKLEFKVKLSSHCNKSDFKVYAIFNGNKETKTELHAVNGVYAYMNVTTDIEILVENIELNKYVLNFTPSDKIVYAAPDVNNPDSYSSNTFSGTKLVLHDGSFEFFVKANDGYDLGKQVVNIYTMKDGTKSLDELEDYKQNIKYKKFVIKNITQDMTISVKNIQDVKYNVNLVPVDGVQYFNDSGMSISGNLKVVHGSNFEFGVSVQDAYDESIPGMFISVNDNTSSKSSAQKLSAGRYMIPNIREDINIQVKNITKNKYIVTLENIEGAEYYSQDNKKITGDNEVAHGESLIFKVELYPAYADSKIKVMCGTDELKPDENKMYEVKNVRENLLVDIGGIEKTVVAKLIETIETLPKEIVTEDDVYEVIEASRTYESLNETQKSAVTNYNILEDLQKAIAPIHHEYNKVIIEGLDWHIKLIADPISTDMEVCARIYDKLSTEYIVSLYDIYLWDTLTDTRYTLPADKTVVLKLPIPDMSYFKDPSGIHEKDGKKLEFLSLTTSPEYYIMETNSLSPVGIIANRTNERGRSSLIDSLDANINKITDYTMNLFAQKDNSENSEKQNPDTDINNSEEQAIEVDNSFFDNIENSNTQGNIGKTQIGSALKLVLILLIILIIITGILIFIKNKNNK